MEGKGKVTNKKITKNENRSGLAVVGRPVFEAKSTQYHKYCF